MESRLKTRRPLLRTAADKEPSKCNEIVFSHLPVLRFRDTNMICVRILVCRPTPESYALPFPLLDGRDGRHRVLFFSSSGGLKQSPEKTAEQKMLILLGGEK